MHPYLKTARRWYRIESRSLTWLRDALFLVLRLYFGYKFILSGLGKLENPVKQAEIFRELKIPLPELNVYMAGATELFGGLFLALGLASRLAPIPLIVTMLVAYMTAHSDQWEDFWTNTPNFIKAPPFAYLYTAAVVFACGPGRFSLDSAIGWYLDRTEAADAPGSGTPDAPPTPSKPV
jgi:putative oxidoreductase